MVERPEDFPDWAMTNPVDPVSGQLARVEPPPGQKLEGWSRNQIPPRQWVNWLAWKTAQWIRYLDSRSARLIPVTVAELPPASENLGVLVLVVDEAGGPVPAFSDGSVWRRVTDRQTVSA